jgi:hypothetical protein
MKIPELQRKLKESHDNFITKVRSVAEGDFTLSVNQKWTAGQQLDHIIKSVRPVNQAFAFPGFMLKVLFGKANRPSRTYDQLTEKYRRKLTEGGRAGGRFIPAPVSASQRTALINTLEKLTASLSKRIEGFTEEQLDLLILPHPLLGKLTLREMVYFTIYHAGHHEKQVTDNLT